MQHLIRWKCEWEWPWNEIPEYLLYLPKNLSLVKIVCLHDFLLPLSLSFCVHFPIRELVALLLLSSVCLVTVNIMWLVLTVPWVGLQWWFWYIQIILTYFFLWLSCYLSYFRMNKPTHTRNTDIVASIKPDLPKRPLTKQPSEHVYLELQGRSHL